MRRDNRVRDAGVAGSNPATPTKLSQHFDPYRDSYWDRNDPATVLCSFRALSEASKSSKKQNALGRNTESVLPKCARSDYYGKRDPGASGSSGRTLLGHLIYEYLQCVALTPLRALICVCPDPTAAAADGIFKHPREPAKAA